MPSGEFAAQCSVYPHRPSTRPHSAAVDKRPTSPAEQDGTLSGGWGASLGQRPGLPVSSLSGVGWTCLQTAGLSSCNFGQGEASKQEERYDPDKFRGTFINYTPRAQRHKENGTKLGWPIIIALVFALIVLWRFLLTGIR